jgi:hypothetical protein
MYESDKIKEARYFLTLVRAKQNEPVEFRYLLSAFLAAARSVMQYALKEADSTPKSRPPSAGKRWYDQQISSAGYATLAFLRDKRNDDIHVKPVSPRQIVGIGLGDTLRLSEAFDVRAKLGDAEAKPVETTKLTDNTPAYPNDNDVPASVSYRYEFHGWTGPEDVLELCEDGYDQLLAFVKDGQRRGFLIL